MEKIRSTILRKSDLPHSNSAIFIKVLPCVLSHLWHELLKDGEHPVLGFHLVVAVLLGLPLLDLHDSHLQVLELAL